MYTYGYLPDVVPTRISQMYFNTNFDLEISFILKKAKCQFGSICCTFLTQFRLICSNMFIYVHVSVRTTGDAGKSVSCK